MNTKLIVPPGLGIIEFNLSGMICYRWFDENMVLFASSPKKGEESIRPYLDEYGSLAADPDIVKIANSVEPLDPANLAIKLHGILDLVREESDAEDEGAETDISPEQVEAKAKELAQKNP